MFFLSRAASSHARDFAPLQFQNAGQNAAGTAGTAANNVAASLGVEKAAADLRAALPRWGYSADIGDLAGPSDKIQSYGIGVAIQLGYGVALAILTVLVGCLFCCCRCCCNYCGGREPEVLGYTKCQRWGTLTVMFLFSAAVVYVFVFIIIVIDWIDNCPCAESTFRNFV